MTKQILLCAWKYLYNTRNAGFLYLENTHFQLMSWKCHKEKKIW